MKRFEKHIFICENKREDGHYRGCCKDKNSDELKIILKEKIKENRLKTSVRINSAGCLDACEHGPAIVVYPEQIWYGNVTKDDLNEIFESHIINGVPVERLKIKEARYNKDAK